MNAPADELYFTWLYNQIGTAKLKNPARTHWALAKQLYKKEFFWFVPNDDNRAVDGQDLRYEFAEVEMKDDDPSSEWMGLGCSMLEMLIALSRRLSFLTDIEPREWFWELLENIGVGMAYSNDQHYNDEVHDVVDALLNVVIWRTYSSNGVGGLFPLDRSDKDQREIEIWYQMSAYLAPDV